MRSVRDARSPRRPDRGPSELHIRSARVDDLVHVEGIERASYSSPWSLNAFRTLLGRPRVSFLVGTLEGDEPIGYAILWRVLDEAELANLAVDPAFRRRGFGAALLDRTIEEAHRRGVRALFLEVRASNEAAAGLYESRGFRQVALREHYYDRPREDARVLRLDREVARAPDDHETRA